MAKCSVCGTELEEGQRFCFECGAPVPQTKKCIKCGAEIALKMKFCPECGTNQNGKANAENTGFSMGDKNVIAGDVIGHKEETHVAGNATFIKNEDQTKQVKKCHVCGSLVQIIDGFDCPECGQFTCQNCYDEKEGCCTECSEKHGEQKNNRYKEALKMVLADGRIEFAERKELISLQQELGISAEKAKQLEEEVKNAALGGGSEITTFEKVSMDKAQNFFYKEGNIKEALNLLEPVYKAHKNDEKVLDIYLPVLAESAPLDAIDVINGLQIDILTAFVVSIGIYIKQKNLVEAEKRLNQALRIWHESTLLKCYDVLFNYAMYKQFNDSSFLEKATNLAEQLGEAQTELDLSYQVKVQAMLQEESGEPAFDFNKDFCEQNHLYWYVMQGNLISNADKSNLIVGKDGNSDFTTIQEALDYADKDAIINIKPGIYQEHLVFKKKIHLIGSKGSIENKSSMDLPIVVFDPSKSCEIDLPIEIEGVVFTHEKTLNFNKLKDYINPESDIDDFPDDDDDFKSLFLIRANAYLNNIAVLNTFNNAIDILSGEAVIINSFIFHSNERSLELCNNSKPRILNCEISNSRIFGIAVRDEAAPEIENCDIHNSYMAGIVLWGQANPTVTKSKIYKHDSGVWIRTEAAGGMYEDCSIHDNQDHGLWVVNSASPSVNNCEIYDNFKYGILIEDNAGGTYKNCYIHNNKNHGIGSSSTIKNIDSSSCRFSNNG